MSDSDDDELSSCSDLEQYIDRAVERMRVLQREAEAEHVGEAEAEHVGVADAGGSVELMKSAIGDNGNNSNANKDTDHTMTQRGLPGEETSARGGRGHNDSQLMVNQLPSQDPHPHQPLSQLPQPLQTLSQLPQPQQPSNRENHPTDEDEDRQSNENAKVANGQLLDGPNNLLGDTSSSGNSGNGTSLMTEKYETDIDALKLPDVITYNFLKSQPTKHLGPFCKTIGVKRSIKGRNLNKDDLVAGAFLRLQKMSIRAGKTTRETVKGVHPQWYKTFKGEYNRLVTAGKVLKLPDASRMRTQYSAACNLRSPDHFGKSQRDTTDSRSRTTPQTTTADQSLGDDQHTNNGVGGDGETNEDGDLRAVQQPIVMSYDESDENTGCPSPPPKISTVSCGSFSVGEFARYMLILRGDETLFNEYKRNLDTSYTRLEADRRKNANEVYRTSLTKIYNDPNYKVYAVFPAYVNSLSVDFSRRKRSGKELKKELELFKNAFTRVWQAFNRSGQNEPDWAKFNMNGNRKADAELTQKLLVLGHIFDIQYRNTDIAFISTISKLADDSGEAGDEGGFGVESSIGNEDVTPLCESRRKKRTSSSGITTDMIGPLIKQTVEDAYTSIVGRHGASTSNREQTSMAIPNTTEASCPTSRLSDQPLSGAAQITVTDDDMKHLKRRAEIIKHIIEYNKLMLDAEATLERDLYKKQVESAQSLLQKMDASRT